jgi:hypothetical protein
MYNIEGAIWIKKYIGDVKGKSILEFGNQHIWEHAKKVMKTDFDVAKQYYESLGAKYVSIDINGQDGALIIDLTKPLPEEYAYLNNSFDYVTNIGTTEHFKNNSAIAQWQAFKTAIDLAKVGGIVLHQLPPKGMWLDHCAIWYNDGFGVVLKETMNCELIIEERFNLPTLNPGIDYLCIALRKTSNVVPSEYPDLFLKGLDYGQKNSNS